LCDGEIVYSTFIERLYTTLLPLVGKKKLCITLTKEFSQNLLKGKLIGAVGSIKIVDVFLDNSHGRHKCTC
jgi:hypothetical protein